MSKNKRSVEDIDGTDKDGAIFVVNRPKSLKIKQNNQKETEGGQGYIGQDPKEGVIKNKKAHSQKLIKMGTSYKQSGDFLKAIECYEKALPLSDHDDHDDLYTNIAFCYEKSGNFPKAIEYYVELMHSGVENSLARSLYQKLAICYQRLGDFLKAIECYEKAIKPGSKDPIIFVNLGCCYHKSGNLPKAIECYEKAIQLGSKDPTTFNNLGLCYHELGNLLKAIEHYEKAAKLGHTFSIASIGDCYQQLGNLPKAIEHYEKAINLLGSHHDIHRIFNNLGLAYQRSGDMSKAVEFYIKFLQLQPDLCKIVFNSLREISFDLKIVKHVTGVILKAIELNMALIKPDSKKDVICKAHFNIAEGYLLYSTFDKSKEKLLLEKAATHYYKSGSKKALEKILEISKDPVLISKAYYELGNFAFSENNYQKAVELYKKSLESQDKAKVIVGVYTQLALAYDKIPGKEKEKIEANKEATKYLPTLYEEISESTALPSALCDIILSSYVGIDQYSEQHKNNQKLEQLLGDSEDITEVL